MKNQFTYVLITTLCFSCGNPERTRERSNDTSIVPQKTISEVNKENVPKKLEVLKDTVSLKKARSESVFTKAIVLSVREELIMPSDYLTTAMTIKTETNDTLVFLDMYGFEKLVNQEISVQYKLTSGNKLLVCFDCNSYSEKVELYDITSVPSTVVFESLRLKEYVQDPYIDPASTFIMFKKGGNIEEYYSNNNDLISDSIKMATGFFNYGIITKLYPELENREELEQLVK